MHKLQNSWIDHNTARQASFVFTGSKSGDTWIGIFSTANGGDTKGESGGNANFRGYNDFILDNLHIQEIKVTPELIIEEAIKANSPIVDADYTYESLNAYKDSLRNLIYADKHISLDETHSLVDALTVAKNALTHKKTSITINDLESVKANRQNASSDFTMAFDNNPETLWHTSWAGDAVGLPALATLKQPQAVTHLDYLPRSNGSNGRVKAGTLEIIDANSKSYLFEFSDWANDGSVKRINFHKTIDVKQIIFTATETYGGSAKEENQFVSAAELHFGLALPESLKPDQTVYNEALIAAKERFANNDSSPILDIENLQAELVKHNLWTPNAISMLTQRLNHLKPSNLVESEKPVEQTNLAIPVNSTEPDISTGLVNSSKVSATLELAMISGKIKQNETKNIKSQALPNTGSTSNLFLVSLGSLLASLGLAGYRRKK